ncbi:hypothetical protein ACOME3_007565 [Neoechinorhynchus agilis]
MGNVLETIRHPRRKRKLNQQPIILSKRKLMEKFHDYYDKSPPFTPQPYEQLNIRNNKQAGTMFCNQEHFINDFTDRHDRSSKKNTATLNHVDQTRREYRRMHNEFPPSPFLYNFDQIAVNRVSATAR